MIDTEQKIQMFNMDMEYPVKNFSLEAYTNYLVNQKMNEFVKQFENSANKIFVLDYKDDLISLICYRMLKNLQQVCPFKFQLVLYGKVKYTKKDIVKKEKKIFSFRLKKLIKSNNTIIIQPFNPLYEVAKTGIEFKEFGCPIWKPLEKFTPDQLRQVQIFYQLGYYPKDKIQLDRNPVIQQFSRFCNGDKCLIDFSKKEYQNNIALVKLTGEIEEDTIILNAVEDFDGLIFYFYTDKYPQILDSEFSFYLKNKANIPDESNINNCDMPIAILRSHDIQSIYFGEWSSAEKLKYK